jgi:hypothetical protein
MPEKTFAPKRDKVTGKPKLHDEKVHDLCSSPNIIRAIKSRRTRWAGDVRHGAEKCAYMALVGKLDGKKAFGIWMYTIRIYFQEISLKEVDKADLAQDTASGGFA